MIAAIVEWFRDLFDCMLNCTCEEWCVAEFGHPAPVRGTPGCDYCERKQTKEQSGQNDHSAKTLEHADTV